MPVRGWLQEALDLFVLEESSSDYLFSRGADEDIQVKFGMKTWDSKRISSPSPSALFKKRYYYKGERLDGRIICPLFSPGGDLLGFEARDPDPNTENKSTRFLLDPYHLWSPIFIGMPEAMEKIWNGGDIWCVEGLFDVFAMRWVVPEKDAVVATLRAKMTDKHLLFFSRFLSDQALVRIIYDRDRSGEYGLQRAIYDLKSLGIPYKEVIYWGGNDPGKIWETYGEERVREMFAL